MLEIPLLGEFLVAFTVIMWATAWWVLRVALMFLWLVCFDFFGKLHIFALNALVNIWPKCT